MVRTEGEMIELGRRAGEGLAAGDVLALAGPLGAGKTHFVKGLVLGLDSADSVTSPTFTIVHEYRGGRLPVFHFDFYRMESAEEVLAIGWDEYFDGQEGVVVAEWADKYPQLFPEHTRWRQFEIIDGGGRRVREGVSS